MAERPNKLREQLARVQRVDAADQPTHDTSPAPSPAASVRAEPAATTPALGAGPVARRRRPVGRPAAGPQSWDERVKRATFYIDRALLERLDECCEANDVNKSEFVREAITRHLQKYC